MPRSRKTTEGQLAEIRAGLLSPGQLWARVQGLFLATHTPPANQPVRRWQTPDGWSCTARTRREARRIIQRATGRAVRGLRVAD